ncbi:uncharacterized protein AAG666_023222 isoform 2-T18 [Megaptera novaeangliae]
MLETLLQIPLPRSVFLKQLFPSSEKNQDALLEKLLRGRKQERLMKWTRQNWRTRIQIRKDGAMTMEKDMRMVNVILGLSRAGGAHLSQVGSSTPGPGRGSAAPPRSTPNPAGGWATCSSEAPGGHSPGERGGRALGS